MRLDDSPRVHEANRRHAIDQALWFLWNRAASKAHKAEEALILDLKRIHDGTNEDGEATGSHLSGEQIHQILAMLPIVMQSDLRERL